MRHATFSKVASLLLAAGLAVACGSSDNNTGSSPPEDAGLNNGNPNSDSGGTPDQSAPPPYDAGMPHPDASPPPVDSGRACIAHCTHDTDCQSSCPMPPGNSLDCCDTATGVCFVSPGSVCPVSSGGDGGMPPPY